MILVSLRSVPATKHAPSNAILPVELVSDPTKTTASTAERVTSGTMANVGSVQTVKASLMMRPISETTMIRKKLHAQPHVTLPVKCAPEVEKKTAPTAIRATGGAAPLVSAVVFHVPEPEVKVPTKICSRWLLRLQKISVKFTVICALAGVLHVENHQQSVLPASKENS